MRRAKAESYGLQPALEEELLVPPNEQSRWLCRRCDRFFDASWRALLARFREGYGCAWCRG